MSRERATRRFYRADSCHELRAFLDRGQTANQENRWTFEVAWEAANKGYYIDSTIPTVYRCRTIFV